MIEREDPTCDDCCKQPKEGDLIQCPCGMWLCRSCLERHHPEMINVQPKKERAA